ncbi:MAG: hypothetical protein ACRELB_01205 [Polyangiaceae bacterium]
MAVLLGSSDRRCRTMTDCECASDEQKCQELIDASPVTIIAHCPP